MALITPEVAQAIAKIVREHHAAVAAALFGEAAVTNDAWQLATDLGLVDPLASTPELIAQLHTFGALIAHIEHAQHDERYGTTLPQFMAAVADNPVPKTEVERQAATWASQRAAQRVVGLGNKVGAELGSDLIEADRALDVRLRSTMRDVVAARFGDTDAAARMRDRGAEQGLDAAFYDHEFRSTTRRMVSDLGHATGDWSRDLQRIMTTEGHDAVQNGVAEAWKAQELEEAEAQGRAPRRRVVFKLPRPDACRHCIRLHLDGGVPRLFHLDDVEANGTNVGRKTAQWLVVIGTTHPWCGCPLLRVPDAVKLPHSWHSGMAAPSAVGPGGRLVFGST